MKTRISIQRCAMVFMITVAAFAAASAPGGTGAIAVVTATTPSAASAPGAVLKIQSIEPTSVNAAEADVTWLGVSAEEVGEALSSQLGLKSGEGLLITFVAPGSPAAKAGLQRYDVLVELRDQLLVHPAQLVKLIRSQKDGDTISLAFFRQAKKQTISAILTKRPAATAMWPLVMPVSVNWKSDESATVNDGIHGQLGDMHAELMKLGADKEKVRAEVERSMEAARQALQGALRHTPEGGAVTGLDARDLQTLARSGMGIGENATIVMKKDGRAIRTIVQTDEAGSFVLVATPRKQLTARDKDGKELFDGEIETPEQQAKVPADLWEKVKPLLDQLKPRNEGGGKPRESFEPAPQY